MQRSETSRLDCRRPVIRIDELREKGEQEQNDLGIEEAHQDAAAKDARVADAIGTGLNASRRRKGNASGEVDEIGGAEPAHRAEQHGRLGDDRS